MKTSWFCRIILFTVLVFLVGPSFILFVASLSEKTLSFPPQGFTFKWYTKAFSIRMFKDAFVTSLLIALTSTFTGVLFGIPASYAISRFPFRKKELLKLAFLSPAVVPHLVIGYAILRFLIARLNIPVLFGLYLGHTLIVFPYIIRVTVASLSNLDSSIDEAAISLGAPYRTVLLRIILPNIRTGVLAAFILGFVTSFNNVPVSLFLTGPGVTVLPLQMMSYVEYYYDPTVAALSSVLVTFAIGVVQAAERTLGLSKYF